MKRGILSHDFEQLNYLLRYLRINRKCTIKEVADWMQISIAQYKAIEKAERLMTIQEAKKLGKFFELEWSFIYSSAMQIDLMLVRNEVVISILTKTDYLLSNTHKRKPVIYEKIN